MWLDNICGGPITLTRITLTGDGLVSTQQDTNQGCLHRFIERIENNGNTYWKHNRRMEAAQSNISLAAGFTVDSLHCCWRLGYGCDFCSQQADLAANGHRPCCHGDRDHWHHRGLQKGIWRKSSPSPKRRADLQEKKWRCRFCRPLHRNREVFAGSPKERDFLRRIQPVRTLSKQLHCGDGTPTS